MISNIPPSPPTLLTFPPELRTLIYEFVFASPYATTLPPSSSNKNNQHPLPLTSHLVRTESLPLFYTLTRLNAHLDDGPITPLAKWLRAIGPESTLLLREVNVWDLHMLNATLHGEGETRRLLAGKGWEREGGGDDVFASGGAGESDSEGGVGGGGGGDENVYVLRPLGEWVQQGGWYLKDLIVELFAMGLGLRRFCRVRKHTCRMSTKTETGSKTTTNLAEQYLSKSRDDGVLPTDDVDDARTDEDEELDLTSHFAIVRLHPQHLHDAQLQGKRKDSAVQTPPPLTASLPLNMTEQSCHDLCIELGFSPAMRDHIDKSLASGQREVFVSSSNGRRIFNVRFDEEQRVMGID